MLASAEPFLNAAGLLKLQPHVLQKRRGSVNAQCNAIGLPLSTFLKARKARLKPRRLKATSGV
jgi:hypothetical protein